MEKRSPKSPVLYERHKSGCAWGLIRFCDFGQVHSNRKLISHRSPLNSQVLDDRDIKNGLNLLSKVQEKCQCIDDGRNKSLKDSAQANVIRRREGEMATEPLTKKKITNIRRQNVLSDTQPVGYSPTNHKRKASKTFQIYGCKGISTVGHRQPSCPNSVDQSSEKLNPVALTEAPSNQMRPKNGRDCSCRSVSHQKYEELGEVNLQVKMNEAAEAFINQKLIKGKYLAKNRASHESKHFLDALEILNSNKELFIKLLQDPNSLLVKHIQDLSHSQAQEQETKSSSEAKLSEDCRTTIRESVDPQTSDRIVVLKPGSTTIQDHEGDTSDCSSPQSHYSLRNRVQSTKAAYFSFEHMKRKLRHAIGLSRREKPQMATDFKLHKSPCDVKASGDGGKGKAREITVSNSLRKNFQVTSEMAKSSSVKRRDKLGEVKDAELGIKEQAALNGVRDHGNSKSSIVSHLKQSENNIYHESRTHLSKVSRVRNEDFSRKQIPLNSGRIASLPEYDFFSALSLGSHRDHGFLAAQMRFSPYSCYQMVNEKKERLQREKRIGYTTDQLQIFDKKPNTSGNHFPDIRKHGSVCSVRNTSGSRGSMTTVQTYASAERHGLHNLSACPAITYEDNGYSQCAKLVSSAENCTSTSSEDIYSSSPMSSKRLEDSDGTNDQAEHPSPVSVLDHFFVEDIASPTSSISQSAEVAIYPKQDNYEQHYQTVPVKSPEDLKINSSDVIDEHESMYRYIMAVLQASGIKWEELSMKFHSLHQLLEPVFLHEMESLLPNQFTDDRKLLLNYIHEILSELHQCYFSSSPWVSFLGPKTKQVQAATNVINQVMKCVDWNLLSQHPSLTLEQLVHKDLAKSRTWMDIRTDGEDVVNELVEGVLEELTLEMSVDLHV